MTNREVKMLDSDGQEADNAIMSVVTLREAEHQLSALLDRAASGEDIVIEREGGVSVRLMKCDDAALPAESRQPGTMKGEFWIADDFDDPLPDWLMDLFEGRDERVEW